MENNLNLICQALKKETPESLNDQAKLILTDLKRGMDSVEFDLTTPIPRINAPGQSEPYSNRLPWNQPLLAGITFEDAATSSHSPYYFTPYANPMPSEDVIFTINNVVMIPLAPIAFSSFTSSSDSKNHQLRSFLLSGKYYNYNKSYYDFRPQYPGGSPWSYGTNNTFRYYPVSHKMEIIVPGGSVAGTWGSAITGRLGSPCTFRLSDASGETDPFVFDSTNQLFLMCAYDSAQEVSVDYPTGVAYKECVDSSRFRRYLQTTNYFLNNAEAPIRQRVTMDAQTLSDDNQIRFCIWNNSRNFIRLGLLKIAS